jgi:hypothetical protein
VSKELESRTVNDHYGVERRVELVTRRIKESRQIAGRNKELIFRFTDNCSLRGLSKLRVLFYLNRFWNIARLTEKDFDKMGKGDIEELVRKIQMKGFEPRTISDHLTAVKTFWKWLEGNEDVYPEKVRWIKPWRILLRKVVIENHAQEDQGYCGHRATKERWRDGRTSSYLSGIYDRSVRRRLGRRRNLLQELSGDPIENSARAIGGLIPVQILPHSTTSAAQTRLGKAAVFTNFLFRFKSYNGPHICW